MSNTKTGDGGGVETSAGAAGFAYEIESAAYEPGPMESHLRQLRDSGSKLLVPYVTAGMSDDWLEVVRAVVDAGASAVEIGLPFSDPMIDGPVIQEASQTALDRGTTVASVFEALRGADIGVPLAVMTYYNLVFHLGDQRFAAEMVKAGVAGVIIPDLPLEESVGWRAAATEVGIEPILLVAPSTADDRARAICAASRGFVYAVGLMGVTGERQELAHSAADIAHRLHPLTDKPVCVGIGVSTPDQAVTVCDQADGVVVGSALVRRILEGEGPSGAAALVAAMRLALDRI